MSRGVVLWPDDRTSSIVWGLWRELEDAGIATLSTESHGRHRPHVSLAVGEDLDHQSALEALVRVPEGRIPLRIDSVGIFPDGTDVLHVVMSSELQSEYRRVNSLVEGLLQDPWPYYQLDRWTPHLTIAHRLTPVELSIALPIIGANLPVVGTLETGGVEDGGTGERWIAGSHPGRSET
jgi:hypothetical protein